MKISSLENLPGYSGVFRGGIPSKFSSRVWAIFSVSALLILALVMGGCVPAQYLPTYPNDSNQIARDFVESLEVGVERENLQDVARLIDDRYSDYSNGRQTLLARMDEIFNQYEVQRLDFEIKQVTPFRGGLDVRANWILRLKFSTVNLDRGCPEERKGRTVVRKGTTTFELVQSGIRWTITEQIGDVLLGLFEPGDAIP
jgi:hypothetical protein